ncbi:MAG: T9SS type A sorting domain-containing protein [Bacteroidetes bacterium]|nr:T9SS type A sorting domain-containing protein [Bacteroidota bacterium]
MHPQNQPYRSHRQSLLVEKWRKVHTRIQRKLKNGTFQFLSRNEKYQLLKRLRRYYSQLQKLGFTTKKLIVGSTLVFSLLHTSTGFAQSFEERAGADNPLELVNVGEFSAPDFVDIDNDGDYDVFVGEKYGMIRYYENIGTPENPLFEERTDLENPLDFADIGSWSVPEFADMDNDGDFDVFIGELIGTVPYFENIGTNTDPMFVEQMGPSDPFDGVNVGFSPNAAVVDIDNDSDLDIFIGEAYGGILYYRNTGTITDPVFLAQTGSSNPFEGVDIGWLATPDFADLDNDGDLDALVGENYTTLFYFQNTGTNTSPIFEEQTGMANPFYDTPFGENLNPAFVDIDNDGDSDVFVGDSYGMLRFFENTTPLVSAIEIPENPNNHPGDLFPNPIVAGEVFIEYAAPNLATISISIYDITGRLLSQQKLDVIPGENLLRLDCSMLSSGSYVVEIGEEEHRSLVVK